MAAGGGGGTASSTAVATIAIALSTIASACRSPCAPSTPPQHGIIFSCCGFGVQGYYWDGETCRPDTVCECEGHRADPSWRTYDECRTAHLSCPGAKLPAEEPSPLVQQFAPVP